MNYSVRRFHIFGEICILIVAIAHVTSSNDARNLQNHRYDGILNFKDVADHWIGYPKSPYTSFAVTASPSTTQTTPATSAPIRTTKKPKKKKYKKTSNTKRRYDTDDYSDYTLKEDHRNREKYAYDDFDYDYDGPINTPYHGSTYSPSPFIIRSSASTPKVAMVKPSVRSNSQMIKAIYAGTPKVATYVIPDAKKYVVQRVKSELVYVPPASIPPSPAMYAAASNSGMRRLDPLDYDDNGGGSFLGPQDSFPPRPIMNKIAQPGQRQPCHGPDCHQHHKGLVRFYWRRVVYPPNSRGRLRRPGGRTRRRRFRDGGRSPSDQRDVFLTDGDDEDSEDNENTGENNEENDDEEEGEDNEEINSGRLNVWQPGKAYGHDLNEGSNYDDQDRKTYRDKRYAYRKYRKRRKGNFH